MNTLQKKDRIGMDEAVLKKNVSILLFFLKNG